MNEPGPIQLTEYEEQRLQLDEIDRDYLVARFGGKLKLRQEVDGRAIVDVINPGPHVGVLTLPTGRRLESAPKVEAANVFYMLSVAYDLPEFQWETADFHDLDHMLEFVVAYFADLADERLRLGLYRSYVEKQENLARLRGRIIFSRDLPLNFAMRHRVYCEYDELSWDVPENQVVRQVAAQLANWPFRTPLRAQLADIDLTMGEVTPTWYTTAVFDRITYSRFNEGYRPLHQLCRLLMDYTSLDEDEGLFEFQTFLIDMNQLFERFVTRVLQERLGLEYEVRGQLPSHLDSGPTRGP